LHNYIPTPQAIAHTLAEIGKTGTTTIIGGGASSKLLEGKVLPGIAALDEA
jgi:phosphoglycerate kinase